MSVDNKDFFLKNQKMNIFQRGLSSIQKAFIPSYLSHFISLVLIGLIGYLAYIIIANILKDVEPPRNPDEIPYHLLYIIAGIMFAYAFLSYFIRTIAKGISIHSFGKSNVGENAGIDSVGFGFKKVLHWLLLAIIVVFGITLYFLVAGLVAYNFGQTGIIIAVVMIVVFGIVALVLSPILNLIQPLMVLENTHFGKAFIRAFKIGFPQYWKTVAVFLLNKGMVFLLNNIFMVLFAVFFVGMNMSFGFITLMETLSTLTYVWIILSVYISVLSMVYVMSSGFSVSLTGEVMKSEKSAEEVFEKMYSSIIN